MSLLKLTAQLYLDSARDAWKGLQRTLVAVLVLLVIWGVAEAAEFALEPLGFLGGFIRFVLHAALAGTYLSMVDIGVNGLRVIPLSDVPKHLGANTNRIISVLFLLWIPDMAIRFIAPDLLLAWTLLTGIVLCSFPEVVYQGSSEDGIPMIRECGDYMQRNWPEWTLAVLLPITPLLTAAVWLWGWGWEPVVMQAARLVGPNINFVYFSGGLLNWSHPVGMAIGLVVLPFMHLVFLFRGQLFKRLAQSNRRKRAWQAKF